MGHKANKKIARLKRQVQDNIAASAAREEVLITEKRQLLLDKRRLEEKVASLSNALPNFTTTLDREYRPGLHERFILRKIRLEMPPFCFTYKIDEAEAQMRNGIKTQEQNFFRYALDKILESVRREGEKQLGLR